MVDFEMALYYPAGFVYELLTGEAEDMFFTLTAMPPAYVPDVNMGGMWYGID